MNVLSYNIRVGGSVVKIKRVAQLILTSKVGVCFIQEIMLVSLNANLASSLWVSSEVERLESGAIWVVGGVAIMWGKDFLNISFSFRGEGYVGVNVVWRGQEIFLVNVYFLCRYDLKKRWWRDFLVLKGEFRRGSG